MNQIYMESVNIDFKNILNTEYLNELRTWRNQDFVRNNMINQNIIEQEEHEKYIKFLQYNPNNKVFLALNYQKPLAIITMKIHWDKRYIEPGTYLIDKDYLGRGFGIVMNYIQMEYIFDLMPQGEMRITILNKNTPNIAIQKKMKCVFEKNIIVKDKDGIEKIASVYSSTKEAWNRNKQKIEERIEHDFGLKNIKKISERKE